MLRVAIALPEFMFDVSDIVRGIVRFTRNRPQFDVSDLFFQQADDLVARFARGNFQGAVTSLVPFDFERLQPRLPAPLAIVNVGADSLGAGTGWLCNSDEAIVNLALGHVRTAGFAGMALVGIAASAAMQRRGDLLCRHAQQLGVAAPAMPVFDWQYSYHDEGEPRSFGALEKWLALLPPQTCVITCHGFAARCVGLACEKLGRLVPGDVGILSLLDERYCLFGHPAISAVRMNGQKLGYAAMKMLDRMLQGGKAPSRPKAIAPRRVAVRRSTNLAKVKSLSPDIAKAVAFIKENACEGITVKEVLAATQSASRRKFYTDFTEQVGCTPADRIREEKIARAKELLRDSTMTVRRISELCGFKNVTRFQTQFRELVDQTPQQFRRKAE